MNMSLGWTVLLPALCCLFATPALAQGAFLFSDRTASLQGRALYGDHGPLWADFDNDGRLDLLFVNHVAPLVLLRQLPNGEFADVTPQTGIAPIGRDRHGAACADLDNDGDADLLITNGADRGAGVGHKADELWLNNGGFAFAEAGLAFGLANTQGRGRSGRFVDVDADGRLDLYTGNFDSVNVLQRNGRDGRFSDVTGGSGLGVAGPQSAWSDFDDDGDPDVAVSLPLRLFRHDGGLRFTDITRPAGLGGIRALALAWGDADNDGDPDLFAVLRNGQSLLLLNEAGHFVRHARPQGWAAADGVQHQGGAWGDLDNDGDLDFVLAHSAGVSLFENQAGQGAGGPVFVEHAAAVAGQTLTQPFEVAALADYDIDGDLDLALGSLQGNRLLANSGAQGAWLQLQLQGRLSNRMGIGARVTVSRQGRLVARREQLAGDGAQLAAGCSPVHIGLGADGPVDVEIRWPSGRYSRLQQVAPNQLLHIMEPDA